MVHFTGSDIVLFVIGFFLPPLAGMFTSLLQTSSLTSTAHWRQMLFKEGCGCDFLINVGLSLVGYLPGIIHAWWVIYKNREDPRTGRRVTSSPPNSQRRTYLQAASQPLLDGSTPGVSKSYKVVEQRSVPQGQAQPQGQSGEVGQQQGGTQQYTTSSSETGQAQQHTTTSTKVGPDGRKITTITTTTATPVRTTYTTHTTQGGSDKKDQPNPPPY
ncbi:hypothetical protein BGX27_004408 [Mortierella sp. AM989]|nr:hypothetical protein BGX27_004408 [Mortierella sp. AM989]